MKRIVVKGKVQGVFYRDSTKNAADSMGIMGSVQNLANGDVEIYAAGERIDDFIGWCKEGSKWSNVDSVEVSDVEDKEFKDFSVIF